jgi:demethylmenaquinone methyltransferase/2-methoxy-6-polyprenyl-1,4-benzoquinol methylase
MPDTVPFGYRYIAAGDKKRLVRSQFDPIARRYDLADALVSVGLDGRWRKEAIRLLGLQPGDRVLDACGGTARLAKLAAPHVGPDGRVTVCDFNLPMINAGRAALRTAEERRLIAFVQGDAESLCFPDATFDAVTIGLGLRNLVHPEQALRECLRVLTAGGRLLIFEFSVPVNPLLRGLYHVYSFCWMPLLGRLICGTAAPFRYLAESMRVFPKPEDVAVMICHAGFSDVRFRRLFNGIAAVYLGVRPGSPPRSRSSR